MTVKEIDGKWHTVSSSGKVGKRGFSTKANAEAAQARGQALQTGRPAADQVGKVFEAPDTDAERKALGIGAKPTPKEEF